MSAECNASTFGRSCCHLAHPKVDPLHSSQDVQQGANAWAYLLEEESQAVLEAQS